MQNFGGRNSWQNSSQQRLTNNILANTKNRVDITKYSLVTHEIICRLYIVATPVATTHPIVTPAAQAVLAKFVTPKTKTPQQPSVQGSLNVKSVNQALLAASAKRSTIKATLAASKYVMNSAHNNV